MFSTNNIMEEELFYNNIRRALNNLPENINILEEQIDLNTQMKYFDYTKKIRKKNIEEECFEHRDELFLSETLDDRKMEILSSISGIDEVAALRTIEKFLLNAGGDLKKWAILAYQESRMLIQSSLLDEQQVFISTGLGGKGQSLRYFTVLINRNQEELLNSVQQKLVRNELIFEVEKHEGEIEIIEFMEGFTTAKVLLPLKSDIQFIFRSVIDECNQYGNFLSEDLIITNVKVLSRNDILDMLVQNISNLDDDLEEEQD